MKKFKIIFLFLLFFTSYGLRVTSYESFAQDDNKLAALSKQIIEAKTSQELYPAFEELKELYFKDKKYTEFIEFLKSLEAKKEALAPFTNYYIALSRYHHLKHLEEGQAWDEYFSQGNTYRDEIVSSAEKAVNSTGATETLNIYAKLLLWQFHSDQQDAFHEQALTDLMNSTLEYSKGAGDLKPVEVVAGRLSAYGEKGKAKELYKIYIEKLADSSVKNEELASLALTYYSENNLDLAEPLYDVYIERAVKAAAKEELIPLLADIAGKFSLKDPFYAEKVFKKMEEIGTLAAFDEGLEYLRATNLERMKEYAQAKDVYLDLAGRFPESAHADEANYKAGMIYVYMLRDLEAGKGYFEKLAVKETLSPQAVSSLYQLGLLNQWKEDFVKAKEYYDELVANTAGGFTEYAALAKQRLKEIEEARPMEYNLKLFLDVSFKAESATFDGSKIDLNASSYAAQKNGPITITCTPPAIASGCMEVTVQYLWSGNLGEAKPSSAEPAFDTSYKESGTKEINLVVVSAAGVVDRKIILLDIR